MVKITKEAALLYHSQGKPGKIEVVPTKPYQTQRDLSLAYSPGVAEPCLEIQKNPDTERNRRIGIGRHRCHERQTGHGRKRITVQDLRRHRCIRH